MNVPVTELGACPGCGSRSLIPVTADEETNFFCDVCVLCWHPFEGRADLMNPQASSACELGKTACLTRRGPFALASWM